MRAPVLLLFAVALPLAGLGCSKKADDKPAPTAPADKAPPVDKPPPADRPAPGGEPKEPLKPEDVRDRPVLLRLHNATGAKWDEAYVHDGSFRVFGALEDGALSAYLPLRSLYEHTRLAVRTGESWKEQRPDDHLGEERLMPARYTLKVSLDGGTLKTELSTQPPVPTPEDMKQEFAKAERRLKKAKAQAWLHANRSRFAACRGAGPYVDVSFLIAPGGRIGGPNVVTKVSPEAAACVLGALKDLRFPPYAGAMEPSRTYRVPLR
jgi:hypothetical protein